MNGSALKEALQAILAKGDNARNMKLSKFAESKKPKPVAAEVPCPQCGKPMVGGVCPDCGPQEAEQGDSDGEGLAALLEQAAGGHEG